MAIDTRNKRSSAIFIGSPWRGMLPLPDGTIGQADRQHAAFLYSGILAAIVSEQADTVYRRAFDEGITFRRAHDADDPQSTYARDLGSETVFSRRDKANNANSG